jgi:hypothetical protein
VEGTGRVEGGGLVGRGGRVEARGLVAGIVDKGVDGRGIVETGGIVATGLCVAMGVCPEGRVWVAGGSNVEASGTLEGCIRVNGGFGEGRGDSDIVGCGEVIVPASVNLAVWASFSDIVTP